jgi:hypothetical protein
MLLDLYTLFWEEVTPPIVVVTETVEDLSRGYFLPMAKEVIKFNTNFKVTSLIKRFYYKDYLVNSKVLLDYSKDLNVKSNIEYGINKRYPVNTNVNLRFNKSFNLSIFKSLRLINILGEV